MLVIYCYFADAESALFVVYDMLTRRDDSTPITPLIFRHLLFRLSAVAAPRYEMPLFDARCETICYDDDARCACVDDACRYFADAYSLLPRVATI